MTTTAAPPMMTLIDSLRDARRTATSEIALDSAGIRSALADGLYSLLGEAQPTTPYVIRPSSFRHELAPSSYTPFGRMRGALITQLMRLIAIDFPINNIFTDAVAAWRASEGASELVEAFAGLDDDERARLATEVVAHGVVLQQRLGTPPSAWLPRTAVRSAIRLGGGGVILRDHIDLVIGSANGMGSGVALVDITTATLDESMEKALRFHAVVETLKSGLAPRFVATLSTATGQLWRLNVDNELLNRGVGEILSTLDALVARR
ncbi:unannotated protein [freshwater metagenome]|uniref:Unannotated protein n=1 Tax=freshwater metagenome TaxID=449393 RepID=A0A6J7D5B4_9ZZZZ|nr:hypothetical protein [Actinomycetota bacterium]MUH58036.1 hypothetical protein [Actinomycetota bacterium]